jgi:protein-L-isoaspartate(D-aspartate) O-methyltransferase
VKEASNHFRQQRKQLAAQISRQGIREPAVLKAIESVPREAFVPMELEEFAYHDTPLPIGNEQTISQPFIVALMAAALQLKPTDRVLEVGTGSGYAAAILASIAAEVYTIERYRQLADTARQRLKQLQFDNVHVIHGDGTEGWPGQAPYDAIIVAAGGPDIPEPLKQQLSVGGRLVIPVGEDRTIQKLIRILKLDEDEYDRDDLADVRFVPLVGTSGWNEEDRAWDGHPIRPVGPRRTVTTLIRDNAQPFDDIDACDLQPLVERIGEAKLVLIGEATHGTSEFYRMRSRITRELIEHHDFDFVAIEADWPDAARINDYVKQLGGRTAEWQAFQRFPSWMWRNQEVLEFVDWLHQYNAYPQRSARAAGFYGLDLYSLYTSIHEVLQYLDSVDPPTAEIARQRYGCLSPWQGDPQTYGRAVVTGRYRSCEAESVAMLTDLLRHQVDDGQRNRWQNFSAIQNARLVADAEKYYRVMYYGGVQSWNLRDQHMFETLQSLLDHHGPDSKAIVWEHNSHLGDAAATEMGIRGETNVGHLCRAKFAEASYLIGQLTHRGTVAAAPMWDSPVEIMQVRPSLESSYERLCHDSEVDRFLLPLRHARQQELCEKLETPRMERAIGVLYRAETEIQSHYFHASLPHQFDEVIWFNESTAVTPILESEARQHLPHHPYAVVD